MSNATHVCGPRCSVLQCTNQIEDMARPGRANKRDTRAQREPTNLRSHAAVSNCWHRCIIALNHFAREAQVCLRLGRRPYVLELPLKRADLLDDSLALRDLVALLWLLHDVLGYAPDEALARPLHGGSVGRAGARHVADQGRGIAHAQAHLGDRLCALLWQVLHMRELGEDAQSVSGVLASHALARMTHGIVGDATRGLHIITPRR
mmetsp:Transcript_139209/g.347024  ORF Transcript_139209/g.347024 Transcript_139209/m.347024 type:complete len:206 (-) Transcript_139209:1407-2024(-)